MLERNVKASVVGESCPFPRKRSISESSESLNMLSYTSKDFSGVIKIKILRWEITLDFLNVLKVITSDSIRGRQKVMG